MAIKATQLVKRAVEAALGVELHRAGRGKHFYPTLSWMRRWSRSDVVFDVGANDGRTVLRLQEVLPSPRIFAFEPVASTFRVLERCTARAGNVRVFPYAMGEAPGRADIQLDELSVMNSLVTAPTRPTGRETVEIRTVDGMMDELGVEFVHFLKIDTEGYEPQVLRGAEGALGAGRVGIVQAEFHLSEAEGLQRIHDRLAPHGYELFGLYNQTQGPAEEGARDWPHAATAAFRFSPRRLSYADAVYVYTGRADVPLGPPLM